MTAEPPLPDVPEAPPELLDFLKRKRPRERAEQHIPSCEKLIFVAIKTEALALEFVAEELGIKLRKCRDPLGRRYFDLGELGGERVIAVQTEMGALAEAGSAANAIFWRRVTGAHTVISAGMAFGTMPLYQHIGDILISQGGLPYDHRVVRTGENGAPVVDYGDVETFPAHEGLLRRFQRKAEAPPWHGRVWSGLLLSGGARIHCAAFRDELAQQCGNRSAQVVGGDMESVGLLSASEDRARPCWIVVKAISDFADRHRDAIIERSRPVACYSALRFVLGALQNLEEDHG